MFFKLTTNMIKRAIPITSKKQRLANRDKNFEESQRTHLTRPIPSYRQCSVQWSSAMNDHVSPPG